jgi:hypothetical protein
VIITAVAVSEKVGITSTVIELSDADERHCQSGPALGSLLARHHGRSPRSGIDGFAVTHHRRTRLWAVSSSWSNTLRGGTVSS